MGILGKLFGQKEPATVEEPRELSRPGEAVRRSIRYDPALVDSLKRDHTDLVALYQRIGKLLQTEQYDEIRGDLVNFKTRLEAHILTENVRFYTYLEQSLRGDADNTEMMRDFRREMNTIARETVSFVKKYQTPGAFTAEERMQLAKDYALVGELLTRRLGREENNLYPLYQPD